MVTKAQLDAATALKEAAEAKFHEMEKKYGDLSTLLLEYEERFKTIEDRLRLVEDENLKLKNLNGNEQSGKNGSQLFSSMLKKNSSSANIILASVAKENLEKQKISNNITISGLKEATGGDKLEADRNQLSEVLAEVNVDYTKVKRFRRVISKQATDKPTLLIVELNDSESKDTAIKNSRSLKDSEKFKEVFINKELTQSESAEERRLRTERNNLNESLTHGEGRLKYGKEGDKEFYYGIRFGEVRKIDKSTNKILRKY